MDLQVAPNFTSFDAPSGEAPGCPSASVHPSRLSMSPESPRLSHLPALPAMEIRVAPNFASFSAPGCFSLGFPRGLALPVAPADESPGCPGFSIFRLCRRRIFELPRISRPSAIPVMKLRVAPTLRCSGITFDESPSRPEHCIFRLYRRWIFELPRISHPSALLVVGSPGYPGLPPSCLASDKFSGLPRFPHLPAPAGCSPSFLGLHPPVLPVVIFRVTPNLRSSG